jgi:hypothetical protein
VYPNPANRTDDGSNGDLSGRAHIQSYSAGPGQSPVKSYDKATAADYRYVLGGTIDKHRNDSRSWEMQLTPGFIKIPVMTLGKETDHKSTKVLQAPRKWNW